MRVAIIGQQDFGKATMEAFLSRGDECLNCKGALHGLTMEDQPLLIKIHKAGVAAD